MVCNTISSKVWLNNKKIKKYNLKITTFYILLIKKRTKDVRIFKKFYDF